MTMEQSGSELRTAVIAAIVEELHGALYATAFAILRQEADALDAVADGYRLALERADQLADRERAAAWLMRIVRNRAIDLLRARRRRAAHPLIDEARGDPTQDPPDAELSRRDLQARLLDAVNVLSDTQAAVVLLRYFEGLDFESIARRLGIAAQAARTRHCRALAHLREDDDLRRAMEGMRR